MKSFMSTFFFFISLASTSVANADPSLSPNNGEISPNQTFSFSANGTAVQDFWIYIGTSVNSKDLMDSGALGFSDGTYTASGLPAGSVYITLWYKVNNIWLRDSYQVLVGSPKIAIANAQTYTKEGSGSINISNKAVCQLQTVLVGGSIGAAGCEVKLSGAGWRLNNTSGNSFSARCVALCYDLVIQ